MKILYVSSLIFQKSSSAAIRNVGLIRGLIQAGNEVDILTINSLIENEDQFLKEYLGQNIKIYKSDLKIINYYLKNKKQRKENLFISGLKKNIKEKIKSIYFFPDVHSEWLRSYKSLKIDYKKYNLVISSSDTKTSHFVAMKIVEKYKMKWYQIWGDPWKDDINLKKSSKLLKFRISLSEKNILEKADKIFYVSPITVDKMKNKTRLNKIFYLPRGYLKEVESRNIKKDIYRFVYTGILSEYRNIGPLLEKIDEYNQKYEKKIEFLIYGTISETKMKEIVQYNFIKFYGSVSFDKIIEVYSRADVLVFLDNGKDTSQIPGKIYDYLGTNCKILTIFDEINSIYNYFKEELEVEVQLASDINIIKVLKQTPRTIDRRFSNLNIVKILLEEEQNECV
ncbi:hypothetical protein [Cetobacterium sp.]